LLASAEISDAVADAESAVSSSSKGDVGLAADAPLFPTRSISPISHTYFPAPIEAPDATVTAIVHPQTYLNKVVIGWSTGALELWNFRTSKLIHRFKNVDSLCESAMTGPSTAKALGALNDDYGAERARLQGLGALPPAAVTALAKSPAVDVIAVGRASGDIILLNLRADQPIHAFRQTEGPVSGLSFRTDGHAFLAAGTTRGHITVWDLKEKRLHSTLRGAHQSAVTALEFLTQEPVLVTSGADNAVRQWVFDQADNTGRLLRQRAGHSGAPCLVRFYDDKVVLSAGHDRALRMFHLVRDQMSAEFSQGALERQARMQHRTVSSLRVHRATALACSNVRERDWPNILTAHQQDSAGLVWSYDSKKLGDVKLVNTNALRTSPATAVAISACGNFGLVGSADGRIERFNLQSGLYRGRYGRVADVTAGKADLKQRARADAAAARDSAMERQRARAQVRAAEGKLATTLFGDVHSETVTALFSDAVNTRVISASLDGTVRFWDFSLFSSLGVLGLGSPVAAAAYNVDSGLFAAVTDDLRVHIIDAEAQRTVRRFRLGARATAAAFSPDSRILVVSQANGEVRVFDLSTGRLVDWFVFQRPVVSLAFSPKGDFIATAHVGSLGVYLWVNRSYFSHQFLGLAVPERPIAMELAPHAAFSANDAEMAKVTDSEAAREAAAKTSAAAKAAAADAAGKRARAKRRRERLAARESARNKRARPADGDDAEEEDEDAEDDDSDDSDDSDDDDDEEEGHKEGEYDPVEFAAKNPIDPVQMTSDVWGDMVTLSGLPASKWQQLSMLDLVRQRNKPKAPVKAAAQAPFFLGVQTGDKESQLDASALREQLRAEAAADEASALARVLRGSASEDQALAQLCGRVPSTQRAFGSFARAVRVRQAHEKRAAALAKGEAQTEEDEEEAIRAQMAEDEDEDADEDDDGDDDADGATDGSAGSEADMSAVDSVTAFLASMTPADVDAELRSLALGAGEPEDLPRLFAVVRYLRLAVARKRDYEFVQAVAHLFLKIHAEALMAHPELADEAAALALVQKRVWRHVEQFFNSSICMLSYLCNIQQV
jgi:U3 small nucleolar RNA-associated protein 21